MHMPIIQKALLIPFPGSRGCQHWREKSQAGGHKCGHTQSALPCSRVPERRKRERVEGVLTVYGTFSLGEELSQGGWLQ